MDFNRIPTRALGLLLAWLALGGTGWAEYRCGGPSGGHCYGVTKWLEQPEYF